MAYVAPVHLPTSIRHAIRLQFSSPDHDDLIVAKANRLEIWRVTQDGMTCLHTKVVHGTICMLQRLRPKDAVTDLLFVGTERLQYFNVSWNPEKNEMELNYEAIHDIAEPYMRESQSQNKCLVDPTAKYMVMHMWEGVLNVFRLPSRRGASDKLEQMDQIRLTELWMKDSAFIHSRTGHPRIAFLYKTQLDQEEARVAVYRLTKDDKGSDVSKFDPHKDRELDQVIADPYASMLIPVPVAEEKRYHVRKTEGTRAHLGGLLVVGETLLTYFDSLTYSSVSSALDEPKIYVAWAMYDETHYFLADDYGRLDLMTLETYAEPTGVVVTGMTVESLRFPDSKDLTSRASNLVYMGDGMLFVASHHGDSQLLQIDLASRTMYPIKLLSNNGPILDFAIMDMGNREGDNQQGNVFSSGQARIVAGCGAYRDGSLRSIRSGVGLEDYGILDEIQNTKGLFTIKSHGSKKADTLVASFVMETRVFRFGADGDIEEVYEFAGMNLEAETLVATNLPNGHLLQVTTSEAAVFDLENGMRISSWATESGGEITAASCNGKWVLLCVDGTILVSLNVDKDLAACTQRYQGTNDSSQSDQISCLHASPDLKDYGVVGWWNSGKITIVDLLTLSAKHGETLQQTSDAASVPRDISLVQLHPRSASGPTLLVALEDGTVVNFNVSVEDLALSGKKSVTLGSSPARLHILPEGDGTSSVFATTEHASLIYSSEGRIVYSATTADDATYVVPFDSEAFPDSILLSTDKHVRLCHVDKERLTHVKSLPVFETVRRVAYAPGVKAFALGCVKKELVHNEEVITCSVKLVDEIIFQELGAPLQLNASSTLEMVESVIRAELPDHTGALVERFIVGTSFVTGEEVGEAGETRGRILVLGVDEERQLYTIVSHNLKGACRCLSVIDEYIVAGLSKTVVVYSYTEETSTEGSLQKLAAYRPATFPLAIDVSGNMIGVADLMQSLSLVEFTPPKHGEPAKLEEKARHFQSAWATSVCHLDDERWLEADAQGNIIVLARNSDAPTEQDRGRLEITSEIHLGEQINKMRKLNVAPTDNAAVSPKAFLASIEGTLYLYGDIAPQYQDLLITLQTNIEQHVKTAGGINFHAWRSFRNQTREADGPFRFVDGEMVERFLDLNEATQAELCKDLGPSVEDVRNLIEELRRMH
ncbi:DNA damage-binding protein 1 [Akanthomyces lecanii RCEF 1005]|uniref:DNA damage-binding protein 1 n=1 Tax=Akanthomyces lecanii RCEF 1005 TaxID=1081108 RepID=A0A168GXE8_CORDF|nr:DNA damage-binding protein 1 [Akanthomyces lecanii RCEF 1005]